MRKEITTAPLVNNIDKLFSFINNVLDLVKANTDVYMPICILCEEVFLNIIKENNSNDINIVFESTNDNTSFLISFIYKGSKLEVLKETSKDINDIISNNGIGISGFIINTLSDNIDQTEEDGKQKVNLYKTFSQTQKLSVKTNFEKDRILMILSGKIDNLTSPIFEQECNKIISAANKNIIMDFASVSYLSSTGLRVLLKTHKTAKSIGTTITLTNVNKTILSVFQITGFSNMLNIVNS